MRLALAHEFQTLAGLRHPHIISVLDYGFDTKRQPYFTMTYLPDGQTILDAGQDQTFEYKFELIQQLFQTLAYLHQHGVLHRDLKPANILVQDNHVRVLDFGLAATPEHDTGTSVGTPLYLAPELFEGGNYSIQADLYEVGQQADILQLIQRETEGNAFFVVGVIRSLAEDIENQAWRRSYLENVPEQREFVRLYETMLAKA